MRVPLAPRNAAVAHDVLVVAEVDVVAMRVLTVVAERPYLDRPVPRAGHDGLVTVVRPCDIDGGDLAAVAVALGEEELPARRVPADQVAVAAPGHQQAVLHHKS